MKNVFLAVCLFFSSAGFARAIKPFELPNMKEGGKIYKSQDHRDGIFVIEAYFLACPYCNENAPNVSALSSKFADNPRVQVLDVGIDRKDSDYQTWISKHEPNHPVLKDSSRLLVKQLGTEGYPSTYVIDCKGNIVHETSGVWEDEDRKAIEEAVESLENDSCSR